MPYVNVRITEGATQEQKEAIINRITETLSEILGKNPKSTFVVIDEIKPENWGVGGKSIAATQEKQN